MTSFGCRHQALHAVSTVLSFFLDSPDGMGESTWAVRLTYVHHHWLSVASHRRSRDRSGCGGRHATSCAVSGWSRCSTGPRDAGANAEARTGQDPKVVMDSEGQVPQAKIHKWERAGRRQAGLRHRIHARRPQVRGRHLRRALQLKSGRGQGLPKRQECRRRVPQALRQGIWKSR